MNHEPDYFISDCCGEKIIMHDQNGHGTCSECKEHTIPLSEEPEQEKEKEIPVFVLSILIFYRLI